MTLDSIIGDILIREGDYVDHPADKGGPTRWGVTLDTLSEWRGKPVDHEDVRMLSQEEAKSIYRDRYIVKPGFAELPDPLRGLVVDCAVNHGVTRAAQWLQKAAGIAADGIIGPASQSALAVCDTNILYRKVLATRIRFFGRIVTDNPKQAVFAAGWNARAASFVESCP